VTLLKDPRVDRRIFTEIEALFKEARRRRRRRWLLASCVVVSLAALVVAAGIVLSQGSAPGPASTRASVPRSPAVHRSSPIQPLHLDVLSAQSQVSVRFAGGEQEGSVRSITAGDAPAVGLARQGYVLGTVLGRLASVSDDLHHVLHTWAPSDGQYPAPASDPSDVWLSEPYAEPSRAQEFDGYGHPIGAATTLPEGSLVLGQSGAFLLVQGPPPAQILELWNPANQQLVLVSGTWDQEASSSAKIAWTTRNLLYLETPSGQDTSVIEGPSGDRATWLVFSPNGRDLAVVWSPRPGSAVSSESLAVKGEVTVIDVESDGERQVPSSRGDVGPVAWAPDSGRLLFIGRVLGGAQIMSWAPDSDESTVLDASRFSVPSDFSPATGSLIAW
jgi:hypothetical protein